MKPLFRITMSLACLALLLWGGVAVPAETSAVPESSEYLMTVIHAAPYPLPVSLAEAEGEWVVPSEQMVAEVVPPEPGTYEYSIAMETGSLPSACAGEPCPTETFTFIEVGPLLYRQGIDDGGGGGE